MNKLRKMLNPRAVALIGATDREDSHGLAVLKNLLKAPDRPLYPVNPDRREIMGIQCFPSILDAPLPVDLAVIVIPAPGVPRVIDDCGRAGVSGVIILSAGFSESGPEGRELEQQIDTIRKRYGLRVIGPNCLGVIVPRIKLNATFLSIDAKPGKIALISHALGEEILEVGGTVGIGFSMFASLGSLIDVEFGDLIDILNNDLSTRSIMIYMEHIKDPRRFISAGRGFALTKPIIVLKPGRSEKGSRMLAGRTGRPVGDDRVYDAVFRRTGMMRVTEVRDLYNLAEVLDSYHLPRSPRLAVITNDGGVGIIAADALEERGGELSELSDGLREKLKGFLPRHWLADNPIDIMADADTRRYRDTVRACLAAGEIDGVLVIYTPRAASDALGVANAIIGLYRSTQKPVIAVCMGGKRAARGRRRLLASNVPAYATPEEAVKTYLYMYGYRRNIELLYETPSEVVMLDSPFKEVIKAAMQECTEVGELQLEGKYVLVLLKHYGIPVIEGPVQGFTLKLGSYRDPEFRSVLVLGEGRNGQEGLSIGLPPLNRTLARRVIDDMSMTTPVRNAIYGNQGTLQNLEDILVNFSNIIVDYPEIEAMDIGLMVDAPEIHASGATARLSQGFRQAGPYDHLVITPYPSHLIRTMQLPDGTEVLLRPMRPEDESMGREMLTALSEETLRTRFFGVPRIDHDLLVRFCNVDYDREIAIQAQIEQAGKQMIIGGFRLVAEPDPEMAQFAMLVRDDYQKMGIGRQLMKVMIDIAGEKGLREIFGVVLSDNKKMLALCRSMGFTTKREPEGITRVSLTLREQVRVEAQ
jgi:acyl-CoA synthetase (NDP forming)/GNAT superfamily N-acetyltransferase